ncbi:hypothetical protein LCGC14_2248000 [marine sediment metagenome]|uniref:Uncharacterized protein n=1 Tax=marine sediment metagenome TaxID=412755 RepID=A0A0F9D3N9_9ZZZZ
MEPIAEHPGYYRDPKATEFLYNSGGQMVDEPDCWKCGDVRLLKIAPFNRPSQGAWDTDYMVCECREACEGESQR